MKNVFLFANTLHLHTFVDNKRLMKRSFVCNTKLFSFAVNVAIMEMLIWPAYFWYLKYISHKFVYLNRLINSFNFVLVILKITTTAFIVMCNKILRCLLLPIIAHSNRFLYYIIAGDYITFIQCYLCSRINFNV